MSACGNTWEMTLRVDGTGKTVKYEFGIIDVPGVGNNIRGPIREAGMLVSTLRGTCIPNPVPGRSTMKCTFNLKGLRGGIRVQMDGDVTGDSYSGTFRVADAGVDVQQGTALADPGDTGTSGGTTIPTDDLSEEERLAQLDELDRVEKEMASTCATE